MPITSDDINSVQMLLQLPDLAPQREAELWAKYRPIQLQEDALREEHKDLIEAYEKQDNPEENPLNDNVRPIIEELQRLQRQKGIYKEEISRAYLKFAVKLSMIECQKYKWMEFPSAFSAANFGLNRAIEKYDPDHEKEAAFATYAALWIKSGIQTEFQNGPGTFKTGTTPFAKFIVSNNNRLTNEYGIANPDATDDDIADHIIRHWLKKQGEKPTANKITEMRDKYWGIRGKMQFSLSLDAPLSESEDGNMTLGDTIESDILPADKDMEIREEHDINRRFFQIAKKHFEKNGLSREWRIVATRRLRHKEDALTLEDLSQEMSVSRERIRQIETNAVNRLRKFSKQFMREARQQAGSFNAPIPDIHDEVDYAPDSDYQNTLDHNG